MTAKRAPRPSPGSPSIPTGSLTRPSGRLMTACGREFSEGYMQNKKVTLLLLLIMTPFLAECGNITKLSYTIPDNYEGILIVRYECPGGEHVIRQNGGVLIHYHPDGKLCLL